MSINGWLDLSFTDLTGESRGFMKMFVGFSLKTRWNEVINPTNCSKRNCLIIKELCHHHEGRKM